MAKITMKGIFPAPIDKVWRVLHMHRDEATAIHPDILSQRIVSEEGEAAYKDLTFKTTIVFEREWRFGGKPWMSTWQYTQSPPERLRIELLGGDEPFAVGSYWENTYSEVSRGTLILTKGEMIFRDLKAPKFLQGWAVRRGMSQADKEDLNYLRRTNL
ncbi:MAG: hypothetical protein ACE5LS_03690 [Thermoplasmata archaeon]